MLLIGIRTADLWCSKLLFWQQNRHLNLVTQGGSSAMSLIQILSKGPIESRARVTLFLIKTMRQKLVRKSKTDPWHRLQLSCDRILMKTSMPKRNKKLFGFPTIFIKVAEKVDWLFCFCFCCILTWKAIVDFGCWDVASLNNLMLDWNF